VNPWVMTERDALSTFALDVDTASYACAGGTSAAGRAADRRSAWKSSSMRSTMPSRQRDDATFAVHAEGAPSPFAPAGQDVAGEDAVKARTVGRDQAGNRRQKTQTSWYSDRETLRASNRRRTVDARRALIANSRLHEKSPGEDQASPRRNQACS